MGRWADHNIPDRETVILSPDLIGYGTEADANPDGITIEA